MAQSYVLYAGLGREVSWVYRFRWGQHPDAALAQLVEHIIRNDGVVGSNPIGGTIFPIHFNQKSTSNQ